MDADMNVNLEGFSNEDEAKSIGNFVLEATKVLSESLNLNISKLKAIVIAYDFSKALVKVTSSYNHNSPSSFTNSKQATAVGQLVSKINPEGYNDEYSLVLSIDFFNELYDENWKLNFGKEGVSSVIHRLHHELVHVHEKNTLTCLDPSYQVNDYGNALLIPATRVWSEYLANIKSSSTVTTSILNSFIENIERVVNEVPIEIQKLTHDFKKGEIPLDKMFHEVRQRINLIVNSYGYAIGYVHGLDVELKEYSPDLYSAFENSNLNESLGFLGNELSIFLTKFENNKITGYDDFMKISSSIDSIYKSFGINLECEDLSGDYILSIYLS